MKKREIWYIFGLMLLGVLFISTIWAFVLEDIVKSSLDPTYLGETIAERWELIFTTVFLVAIASIVPIWLALRVTGRREGVEQALLKSEMFNNVVLSSLTEHIVVLDSSGTIVTVNEAWKRFARANGNEALAKSGLGVNYLKVCQQSTGPFSEEANLALEGIQSVLSGKRPLFKLEYPCHSPKEERWFLMSASPVRVGDGGAVISHVNITERKQAEEAVRRTRDELEQFASVVSHDLRAPLRGVSQLAGWLQEDLAGKLSEDTDEKLVLLQDRVRRMQTLIDGLLEYSKVGGTQGTEETVDTGALLVETIDSLSPPTDVSIDVEPNMPTLQTDRLRLGQVFANLIGNSIKHHGRNPVHIWVTARDAGRFYEFSVADDGPGIARQYHEKVFMMFQSLAPKDTGIDSGIGLALVKKIVEEHGGSITLDSQEGKGANFRFMWPKQGGADFSKRKN